MKYPRFKVGDIVRYQYTNPIFDENYKHFHYKIIKVYPSTYCNQPSYKVMSLDNQLDFVTMIDSKLILIESGSQKELTPEAWFDIKKIKNEI